MNWPIWIWYIVQSVFTTELKMTFAMQVPLRSFP